MNLKNKLVFDIETGGLGFNNEFICASFWESSSQLDTKLLSKPLIIEDTIDYLTHFIPTHTIIGHNIYTFDLPFLVYKERQSGSDKLFEAIVKYPHHFIDTLILAQVNRPHLHRHSVAVWEERIKGQYPLLEKVSKYELDFDSDISMDDYIIRCENDVKIQACIYHYMHEKGWDKHSTVKSVCDFLPTTISLLTNGIPMYLDKVAGIKQKLLTAKGRHTANITRSLKRKVNTRSSLQIQQALLDLGHKGLPIGEPSEKTGKRSPKINKDNKFLVTSMYPSLMEVYNIRDIDKQLQFLEIKEGSKVSLFTSMIGNRTYPKLNLLGTRTFRAQYNNPPLNTIDKRVRSLIGVKGMVGFDLEALEYLILSYTIKEVFGDSAMWDNHHAGVCPKQWTLEAFGELFDNADLTNTTREGKAKTLNYALLYGQGMKATLAFLGLKSDKSNDVKQALEKRFPSFSNLTRLLKQNMVDKCVVNLWGQKVPSEDWLVLNTYAQSSGAGYAMRMFSCLTEVLHPYYTPIIFNHDEIQYVPVNEGKDRDFLNKSVEKAYTLFTERYQMPIISKLNFDIGDNWSETH